MRRRILALLLLLSGLQLQAGDFRVGAAQVDITPKAGTPMAGYYKFRPVGGVLDPIYSKAMVVEQEGEYAAFVVLDLIGTTRGMVEAARKLVQEQCGISADHVMISATHTHTGPQYPRGTLMDQICKVDAPAGRQFISELPGLIARSVAEAKAKLTPASPSFAVASGKGLSFNRRVLREGSDKAIWQPARINPAIEHPAGPVDPDIGVLVFDSTTSPSRPLTAYLNFAMHPTTVGGGTKVSADYPGVFTRLVRERKNLEMIAAFSTGCCGNINQTDYYSGTRPNQHQAGGVLADATLAAWADLKPLATTAPRARSMQVTLQRRAFSDAEITKAKDIASRMFTEELGTVPMAEAVCVLETAGAKDVPLVVEVQAITFSDDLAIVSLPGEIFVELGLALKKASPFKHTLIAELANGSMGYVPNRDAYPQGAYEVISARGAAGSGEKLVESALQLLNDLKPAR